VAGNIASGSSMTAVQLARHGVKVLREGDTSESDKLQVCWSVAAEQAKGTRLAGRVRLNFYRCYTAASTDAPQTITSSGTQSFDISASTEAACGAFRIVPEKWDGCYYVVIDIQFTTVTGIASTFFNYGIGTLTETLG
jgi:hypothetical protein